MAKTNASLFAQLNALAEEIGSVKTAAAKQAEGPTPADPGTYTGASSHPTAHVDNSVQKAETGARASEYEADIKKQQGALAVDNLSEMSQEGRQDEVQLNIGTKAKATGEDPSTEHDYKGDKDDPGTSHPAKTNDGEKYSSLTFKEARDRAGALGNDILAKLLSATTEKAAEMPEFLKKKIEGKKTEAGEGKMPPALQKAHESSESPAEEAAEHKEAAEASVREVCAQTLREADEMADLFIGYMQSKAAAADPSDEAAEGEDHSAPGDDESGAGAAPMDAGADPSAAAGGDMGGAAGGDMGGDLGGAPSEDEAVQELAMALQELGISPEELLQAAQAHGGGAEGGDAGGMPPAPAPAADGMPKVASHQLVAIHDAVRQHKRSGKFQLKEAHTKRSRQLRDVMKAHVMELMNR